MRIEQLEVVLAVAQSCSMQKAAEQLHTSSQNISKLIKQLEDELQLQIFMRNKYGVFLTSVGETVCEEAKKIMNSVDTLQHISFKANPAIKAMQSTFLEHINILSAHSSSNFAANLLETLYSKYTVNFASIISKDSKEINKLLSDNTEHLLKDYDFIITNLNDYDLTYIQNNIPKLQIYILHKVRLGVNISTNNPLAQQKSISIKEIMQQPLIMGCYDFDYSSHVQSMLESSGITLKPKFVFNSAQSSEHYVQKNLGYGIVPYDEKKDEQAFSDGTIRLPLKERIFFLQTLLINSDTCSDPFIKQTLAVAKKTYKDLQPLNTKKA